MDMWRNPVQADLQLSENEKPVISLFLHSSLMNYQTRSYIAVDVLARMSFLK